jgi:hypothetical protein
METPLVSNIFKSIANKIPVDILWKKDEQNEEKLKEEIDFLVSNRNALNILIDSSLACFEVNYENILLILGEIEQHMHHGHLSNVLNGAILFELLHKSNDNEVEKILKGLEDTSSLNFWSMSHSLPYFLSEYQLNAIFAAHIFAIVGEKIKEDLGSGDFFQAIENYAYNFPNEAIKVFHIYKEFQFQGIQSAICAMIIGAIRASIRLKELQLEISKEESYLQSSHIDEFRIIEERSWIITYQRGAASFEEILSIINRAYKGNGKEIDEAYNIIYNLIRNAKNDDHIISYLLNWIKVSINSNITPGTKFHIINTIDWVCTVDKKGFIEKEGEYKFIFSYLFPLETTYLGIWNKIESVLNNMADIDERYFNDFLNIVINNSSKSLQELITNDQIHILWHAKIKQFINATFTRLFFSGNDSDRMIAFALLKNANDILLIQEAIPPSETILRNILWEFSKEIFLAKGTSKFLLMIEPFFREVNEKLKSDFINEMVFQAVNYPGECLENWKNKISESGILKEVISRSTKYFDNLKSVEDLPANNFRYYEFVDGAKLAMKIQARDLNKKIKKGSVIRNLFKSTQILYGDEWSVGDKPNKFNHFSHSIEYPRMENIDPEGQVLKRIIIISNLKAFNISQ